MYSGRRIGHVFKVLDEALVLGQQVETRFLFEDFFACDGYFSARPLWRQYSKETLASWRYCVFRIFLVFGHLEKY